MVMVIMMMRKIEATRRVQKGTSVEEESISKVNDNFTM